MPTWSLLRLQSPQLVTVFMKLKMKAIFDERTDFDERTEKVSGLR